MKDSYKKAEIDEYLSQELKKAGYSRVEMTKTPIGTRVVVYAAKPGLVIGRRGQSIRDLTRALEEKFVIENPQISVAAVETPELDPKIIASQVAMALQKGVHFRRASYWALQRVMRAGALGVQIVVSGKLTTERSRFEKYSAGYLPKVGDPVLKQLRKAVVHTQLKQGLFGIRVRILPPDYKSPDKPRVKQPIEETKPKEPEEVKEDVAVAGAEN